jgi:hypothetical protein
LEDAVSRRRFDHLVLEISLAAGVRIPRYDLWLRLHELGADPESLSADGALEFCSGPLAGFLAEFGLTLGPRTRRRLCRNIARYDPDLPTPDERLAAFE